MIVLVMTHQFPPRLLVGFHFLRQVVPLPHTRTHTARETPQPLRQQWRNSTLQRWNRTGAQKTVRCKNRTGELHESWDESERLSTPP